jgi:hypothetical protein
VPEKKFEAKYYTDYVGRPRKLSAGAILAVQSDFREGAKTRVLAERYGVSSSLILTICYNIRRISK